MGAQVVEELFLDNLSSFLENQITKKQNKTKPKTFLFESNFKLREKLQE